MFNRTFLGLARNSQRRFRARIAIPTSTKHPRSTLMDIHIEERASRKTDRGADDHRRGKAAGGRGRQGGGRGQMNREVAISKALSKLLRHAAEDEGLVLDKEGFARLDQVMKWPQLKSLGVTYGDIKSVVTGNAKQRFSMKLSPVLVTPPDPASVEPSDWLIRANQGHSIALESAALLAPITLEAGNVPDIVVHGTYFALYPLIVETGGLKKMSRNHIHFGTGLPEDKQGVISGMRGDAELLIYVDIKKSLEDGGILWWISENGVVLTEGDERGILSTKYWKKVVGRRENVGNLWENGEELAQLPQNLKHKRAPRGKAHKIAGNSKGKHRDRGSKGIYSTDEEEQTEQ